MKKRATSTAIVGVVLLLTESLNGCTSKVGHRPCPNSKVVVAAAQPEDWETACRGAIDAITFLEANGFRYGGLINIHIVSRMAEKKTHHIFGFFDSRDERVHILKFSAIRRMVQVFGLPIDRDLYRSIVTHEVAHLIANHNFTMKSPARAAQEYIDYVTQLATMHPSLRKRVLVCFSGPGFENTREINSLVFALAPDAFAVMAYRHFVRPENGMTFFRRLLTGDAPINHGLDLY
jgi:hypothetical protein